MNDVMIANNAKPSMFIKSIIEGFVFVNQSISETMIANTFMPKVSANTLSHDQESLGKLLWLSIKYGHSCCSLNQYNLFLHSPFPVISGFGFSNKKYAMAQMTDITTHTPTQVN